MVPIYDTDLAEERYAREEWRHVELWEKLEIQFRRRRKLWIVLAIILFLGLSSVPVVWESAPRWAALNAARKLAYEMSRVKRQAGLEHAPYRIIFDSDGSLQYGIETVSSCIKGENPKLVRRGRLVGESKLSDFVLLTPAQGEKAGLPNLVRIFCYDPLLGAQFASPDHLAASFAIAPAKDLTITPAGQELTDHERIALLLFQGQSAEISFE
ncbi:hypothetical protein WDW86_09465 [Bdellovibrionota bacterium FG-2]